MILIGPIPPAEQFHIKAKWNEEPDDEPFAFLRSRNTLYFFDHDSEAEWFLGDDDLGDEAPASFEHPPCSLAVCLFTETSLVPTWATEAWVPNLVIVYDDTVSKQAVKVLTSISNSTRAERKLKPAYWVEKKKFQTPIGTIDWELVKTDLIAKGFWP